MFITKCRLTLHDHLFYATREIGRLYETGKYLHNYALTFALGLAQSRYYNFNQVPTYQHLLPMLNLTNVYVTPAKPLNYEFVFHTFKRGNVAYYSYQPQTTVNKPVYGRAKELAIGSTFEFFVFGTDEIPRWIRLGKWMSKAEVSIIWQGDVKQKHGAYSVNHPLNPLDIPVELSVFDLISMPPVSLVNNARLTGDYYEVEGIQLPANMQYTFPEATP